MPIILLKVIASSAYPAVNRRPFGPLVLKYFAAAKITIKAPVALTKNAFLHFFIPIAYVSLLNYSITVPRSLRYLKN